MAAKPDDEPIICCGRSFPEFTELGVLLGGVIKLIPPGHPGRWRIRLDWSATQIVEKAQHFIIAAGVSERPYQRTSSGSPGSDVECFHVAQLPNSPQCKFVSALYEQDHPSLSSRHILDIHVGDIGSRCVCHQDALSPSSLDIGHCHQVPGLLDSAAAHHLWIAIKIFCGSGQLGAGQRDNGSSIEGGNTTPTKQNPGFPSCNVERLLL